jgi:hypothetical protein
MTELMSGIPPDLTNYPGALPHMLYAGSLVFTPPGRPVDLKSWGEWWSFMKGADWIASVSSELLSPLSGGRTPCRAGRRVNEPSRIPLRPAQAR